MFATASFINQAGSGGGGGFMGVVLGAECAKQKPAAGTWPTRWVEVEGKSLNFYDRQGGSKRGSSIQDVTSASVTDGVEQFVLSVQTQWFKVTLERRGLPTDPATGVTLGDLDDGGFSRFCFKSKLDRDAFSAALRNLSAGRRWDDGQAASSRPFAGSVSEPVVDWMYGDAGTKLTRGLAELNPLRWESGTASAMEAALAASAAAGKPRPIALRVKGESAIQRCEDQAAARLWLARLVGLPSAEQGVPPAPEPQQEGAWNQPSCSAGPAQTEAEERGAARRVEPEPQPQPQAQAQPELEPKPEPDPQPEPEPQPEPQLAPAVEWPTDLEFMPSEEAVQLKAEVAKVLRAHAGGEMADEIRLLRQFGLEHEILAQVFLYVAEAQLQ